MSEASTPKPREPATPTASPSATGSASLHDAATAAVTYAKAHGMYSGVAILDTSTGALTTAGVSTRNFAGASVVKVLIAARLLVQGRMTGATATAATKMITRSDNAAASSLYPTVGGDGLEPWIEAHYAVPDLGALPAMPGIWGSTQLTARGLVQLYAKLRTDPKVWPWLSTRMHDYEQRTPAGEPNAFGFAAAQPSAAIKNGWDTNRDPAHPTNAIINSTGFVDGDRYAVAVLSEGPGSLYYVRGESVVTHEAELITAAVGPAKVATAEPLVVLDPGHNGGNASHVSQIDKLVDAGYGKRKACNTTGTETNAGYPEHAFTWDVSKRVRAILEAHGVRVRMTRDSDSGVGPCVDERARRESATGVALSVAIHADGAPSAGHGFHVNEDSRRPEGASATTVADTTALGKDLHRALTASSGLVPSTYIGTDGYYYRTDLAGLNLTTTPTSFLELGNMRNAHDAALQSTASGRQRIAAAVAAGILAYLGR